MPLKPEACRAARGILKWSLRDLGERSGVAWTTIAQLENGRSPRPGTEAKLIDVFEGAGVEILNGDSPGARLRPKPTA